MRINVPVTEENGARCLCAGLCLTYDASELTGAVYCSTGASEDAAQMQGCQCPLCSVWIKYKLKKIYYCRILAAVTQK
ncbi:MAG: DUF2769 domain-containing protein [Halobacteriota archaeon]